MTLVLAIRCRDGVVLASDGQVTAETAGQPTRAAGRKLWDFGGRVAWGAAGCAGLQQTLRTELAGLNGQVREPEALRERLASIVIPVQQRAVARYVPHPGSDPPDLACIFCWCDASGAYILEIPRTGGDHQFHERYCAIGSGDIFARFAMAAIAHLDTTELDLERAKMVAYKAIADAIEVAAVFLGPPIQLYVVTDGRAEPVPQEEVDAGLADSVDAWMERQRETLGPLAGPSRRKAA